MKILVTGGCGFIGSNFIHFILKEEPNAYVVNYDLLTYAADVTNLEGIDQSRYEFHAGDICNYDKVRPLVAQADLIINFAAESHVDRSILDADIFLRTNIEGTNTLLKAALNENPDVTFMQIGTDEVYGSLDEGLWADENFPLKPASAYSASKASADLLALSYYHTHGLKVIVSRSTNNYGPRQHTEKLVPKFITNILGRKTLTIYDDGSQIRDWLWVEDNCRGIWVAATKGTPGEIYNIGTAIDPEVNNLELTETLLKLMGQTNFPIEYRIGARPGHDQRYAVDFSKLRKLGWGQKVIFGTGLAETIAWYRERGEGV